MKADLVETVAVNNELEEEERWLAAVEEGNIEKVNLEDSELRLQSHFSHGGMREQFSKANVFVTRV